MIHSIKILGTGCPKCKTLTKLTEEVVAEHNIKASVEKVEDIMQIMEYNIMTTPALVVNEKVVIKGRVPSKAEILESIQSQSEVKNNDSDCSCGSSSCC